MLFAFFANPDVIAQCPMCKMAAESNMKDGGTAGKGLNTGILYLLAMPYIAVLAFIIIYKRSKKQVAASNTQG